LLGISVILNLFSTQLAPMTTVDDLELNGCQESRYPLSWLFLRRKRPNPNEINAALPGDTKPSLKLKKLFL
jgi:hypothetical protein